jgi:hypothetical protein
MLSPLLRRRLLSVFQQKLKEPCVCLLESEPAETRYAVREITLNSNKVVIDISKRALSPKAASSAELREVIKKLLVQAKNGPVSCGETRRSFNEEDLTTWLSCIGKPVLKILEK